MCFSNLKCFLRDLNIRTKLILLFVFIKVIPVILLAAIAVYGVEALYGFFSDHTTKLKDTTKEVVSKTAKIAIEDSVLALDRKTQTALEQMSNGIAQSVADFLYERDADLLLLASLPQNETTYEHFMRIKTRKVVNDKSSEYRYDDAMSQWVRKTTEQPKIDKKAELIDNEREFQKIDPVAYTFSSLPLYKEITFFDLQGNEQIKVGSLALEKKNISRKENTYIKAEDYFNHIATLKKGEIYVSNVIGAYVPSQIIGTFTKAKAQKAGIEFTPEKHGYAGRENPVGKRFEGIVRFVTPIFDGEKKIGYVSLALDHRHIMEFTDTVDPLSYSKADVSDASVGNYAFMWDYKGRNISHVRDYFIAGFDPQSGKRVSPWLEKAVYEAYVASGKDIESFLETYPAFEAQSLNKKPSIEHMKQGLLGLDCRYLNFAPQCQGWMQLTRDGGLGSFIIFWSNVWKLTTAATIPYYTGQYGTTPRGFGFVTIGANVEEFHKAAQQTKENLDGILKVQLNSIDRMVGMAEKKTENEVEKLINDLGLSTLAMVIFMIFIAVWLSNLLRKRLQVLLQGAKEFSNNNLQYRIEVDTKDEIGELATSFNDMADAIEEYIEQEKNHNATLERRIAQRTEQLTVLNSQIQEELRLKEQQEQKLQIFARIFDSSKEAIILTDKQGIILNVNPAFTTITGYEAYEVIGKTHRSLKSHRHLPDFYRSMWATILSKETWEGEIWNRKKDGTLYPALLMIVPILNKEGDIVFFAGIQRDISIIKENEQVLHQQAYYDPLTKLANRALGYDRLTHALIKAKEHHHIVALLFLDLDKFKQVNDTMGHDIGDLLLCEVAKRLNHVCKDSDTVSRLGGDEFLIVMEEVTHFEEVLEVAEQIIKSLSKPFEIESHLIHSSTSLGVTFYPNDGHDIKTLLKNADIAMYRAKARGRGVYELFTKELGLQVKEAVKLEQELRVAVEQKQFVMHYQPILDIHTQEVIGFEALMRWQREDRLYFPDTFIDMLEHTRLIIDSTESVLPHVLEMLKTLNKQYNKEFMIAVNISSVHFALDEFSDRLIKMVKDAGLKNASICLEVTETIFLHDIEIVSKKLSELKLLGFSIALDDFGTGYSSLEYLKRLPIDKIKIDRAFTKELPHSKGDVAITTSVCSWGENFNLEVIAEGVEDESQLNFLRQVGCDSVQGYYFAKPMDEIALKEYLSNH